MSELTSLNHVYICQTGYHLLLSYFLSARPGSHHLISINDNSSVVPMLNALNQMSIFKDQINLIGNVNIHSSNEQIKMQKENVVNISKYMANIDGPSEYYIFNDTRPETQYLINLAQVRSHSVASYVEDGMAAYIDQPEKVRRLKSKLVSFRTGVKMIPLSFIGGHPLLQRGYFTHKELVHSKHHQKKLFDIPVPGAEQLGQFSKCYFKNIKLNTQFEVLINLPLTRGVNNFEGFLKDINNYINDLKTQSIQIKAHPAENFDWSTRITGPVTWAPPHIPSEVLAMAAPNLKEIAGPMNTSVLASKLMKPNLKWTEVGSDHLKWSDFDTMRSYFLKSNQ